MGLFDGILDAVGVGTTGVPWGTVMQVGGQLLGSGLAYQGQREANDTNLQIANNNTAFNAEQAAISRDWNHNEADLARQFNATEADKARQYTERLANTSYQRAIRDMEAAGLNPMLAYHQGGATTPAGASASGPAAAGAQASAAPPPTIGNKNLAAIQGASAAAQLQTQIADVEKTRAETERIKADTENVKLQPKLTQQQIEYVKNQAREMMERIYGTYWRTTLDEQRAKQGEVEQIIANLVATKRKVTAEAVETELANKGENKAASRYWETVGPTGYGVERGARTLGTLVNSAAQARSAFRPRTSTIESSGWRRANGDWESYSTTTTK